MFKEEVRKKAFHETQNVVLLEQIVLVFIFLFSVDDDVMHKIITNCNFIALPMNKTKIL